MISSEQKQEEGPPAKSQMIELIQTELQDGNLHRDDQRTPKPALEHVGDPPTRNGQEP